MPYSRDVDFGGGGGSGDILARKKIRNTRKVVVVIRIKTQTFAIFPANETSIIAKIAQLKVCILNSISSLSVI